MSLSESLTSKIELRESQAFSSSRDCSLVCSLEEMALSSCWIVSLSVTSFV